MIYLDYAAATPLSDSARQAMEPYSQEQFFNPSAAYLPAVELRHEYQAAKDKLAHVIGAKGADLVITGGATESINLAFEAVENGAEILISGVEHDSVIEPAQRKGDCQIIKVDKTGRILLDDFKKKLSAKTQFVSLCLACSELGTIQPIAEIGMLVKAERQRRLRAGDHTPIYFHCDASQGLGLLEIKVSRLNVDLLTLNAGKIYGPKGVGALYVGHQVKTLKPLIVGGGQELGLRSGTENVVGLMGFAQAAVDAQEHIIKNRKKYQKLTQILREELGKNSQPIFLGNKKHQLANFCPLTYPGLDAERLIFLLEQQQVYVSSGTACSANSRTKSKTLQAIGLTDEEIAGSLRLTLGRDNDEQSICKAAKIINQTVAAELQRLHDSL